MVVVEHDFLVGLGLLEQPPQQQVVEPVTALEARELADQTRTEQVEVAERVEHLVPHELVAETQAVFIQHAVVVHHDRVVEAASERALACARSLEILQEAERPCAADLL